MRVSHRPANPTAVGHKVRAFPNDRPGFRQDFNTQERIHFQPAAPKARAASRQYFFLEKNQIGPKKEINKDNNVFFLMIFYIKFRVL